MIGPYEAFGLGCAAGVLLSFAYGLLSIIDQQARAARQTWQPTPPDPKRSAAGRLGAEVTNARRRHAAELHRKRVLEVAEQMRRDMNAKQKDPNQ